MIESPPLTIKQHNWMWLFGNCLYLAVSIVGMLCVGKWTNMFFLAVFPFALWNGWMSYDRSCYLSYQRFNRDHPEVVPSLIKSITHGSEDM